MLQMVTVVGLLSLGLAGAQNHPDLSGVWVEDQSRRFNLITNRPWEPPPAAAGMPTLPPGETEIQQTAEEVRVFTRTQIRGRPAGTKYVFKVDGSKNVNFNGAETHTTTARWEGTRFIVEGTSSSATTQGEFLYDVRDAFYRDGKYLVVECTSSQDGKPSVATRRYFIRKP